MAREKKRRKHRSSDSDEDSSSSSISSSDDHRRKRKERRKKKKLKEEKKKKKHDRKRKRSSRREELEEGIEIDPAILAADIISKFPALGGEFKQLLKMVDDGQGVDVGGIPDEHIKELLHKLFHSLKLSKVDEVYLLPEGCQPTLTTLAEVLKDVPDQLTQPEDQSTKPSEAGDFHGIGPAQRPPDPPRPRVIGPAMPTPEMFAAAARVAEAEEELRKAEEELPFVGPAPPALVAEAESVNEAERFEEVTRILDPDMRNAYEILGVKSDATSENIKKRYWKLSLLVHPDKCAHPSAQDAFTTINKAFQELQDPTKRAAIDHSVAERKRKEEEEVELRALREAAQWRRMRGDIALAGDDILLGTVPKAPSRDEWMTELPPERQAGPPSMHSTFFSKTEKTGRGDTSAWTDTPLEKAQKARTQYLESYKQATLEAAPQDAAAAAESEKSAAIAKAVDSYNEKKRSESLVSKHKKEQSEKKTKGGNKKANAPVEDWVGNHPWKPWDRENDLAAGRKSVKLDAAAMASGLSSRFGSSGSQRKFL